MRKVPLQGFAFESIRGFVDAILSGEPFRVSIADAANTGLVILAIMAYVILGS